MNKSVILDYSLFYSGKVSGHEDFVKIFFKVYKHIVYVWQVKSVIKRFL